MEGSRDRLRCDRKDGPVAGELDGDVGGCSSLQALPHSFPYDLGRCQTSQGQEASPPHGTRMPGTTRAPQMGREGREVERKVKQTQPNLRAGASRAGRREARQVSGPR